MEIEFNPTSLFADEFNTYHKVLDITLQVSLKQGGIDTTGRGIRASKLFTRQVLLGLSLNKLLPDPVTRNEGEIWDVVGISSLARAILEGYLALYYYGLELIPDEEADIRFKLLQLHKNMELFDIQKKMDPSDVALVNAIEIINRQKDVVSNHPHLQSLSRAHRGRALKFNAMYYSRNDFEDIQAPGCGDLRLDYKILSNRTHALPFLFERMSNEHGRGIGSDMDVANCYTSLVIARTYLVASTIGIADFFPTELRKPFETQLADIRPLVNK